MLEDYNHFDFHVISAQVVEEELENSDKVIALVAETYLTHEQGLTTNPDSYFLHFPEPDSRRIIALPAAIHGENPATGIKWIASYPSNLKHGLQRASAVLILNDPDTGYPVAVLEGGRISATRTAASAVLGAYWINGQRKVIESLSMIGAGYIARNICQMFHNDGWQIGEILIHDHDEPSSASLLNFVTTELRYRAKEVTLETALNSHVVCLATNSSTPYIRKPTSFAPEQIVLNISLRDIAPEIILESENIFDDISHCLKANTSPHLAELLSGGRDFVTGTIGELIRNDVRLSGNRAVIYSPFGMGILDLALGRRVFLSAVEKKKSVRISDFLGAQNRW